MGDKILLNSKEIEVIINRLCCQLIENHMDFKQTVLIGIQPRGTFLAQKMVETLSKKYGISDINFGVLDITFFRDDFRRSEKPLVANTTDINFIVENKQVVFIDDVLYTGRSIRAALTAIQSFGRPSKIELLVFIDRRFSRHLPIQPDYTGWKVDAINEERVVVHWAENDKEDAVYLIHKK
jgi:bifunctional protein pyrR